MYGRTVQLKLESNGEKKYLTDTAVRLCYAVLGKGLGLKISSAQAGQSDLKGQLTENEGFVQLYGKIVKLKLLAPDGKMRGTGKHFPHL